MQKSGKMKTYVSPTLMFTSLHLPLFTPRLWLGMLGDTGDSHKQTVGKQAIRLELLHLPREVSLPFMSQLKFSSQAIHSVNDKKTQNNLATPCTNNTVMVRDRSS